MPLPPESLSTPTQETPRSELLRWLWPIALGASIGMGWRLVFLGVLITAGSALATPLNKVLGTWRMVSAQLDPDGRNLPAYGPAPISLLVFTTDMHVIEVMTDSTVPKFASNARGHGTVEENQAAMAGSIGWFGTYAVDENGDLSGDRVEGSTFPNWVGDVRTREDIRLVVDGDRRNNGCRSWGNNPEQTAPIAQH
jgi:Lipocalin-like domain